VRGDEGSGFVELELNRSFLLPFLLPSSRTRTRKIYEVKI